MNDLITRLGLLRSRANYFWKPFTRSRLRRFYRHFAFPGSLGFDIGAHLGSRSRAFHDLGARVVALEPQPACAAYLRRRWHGERRFTLVPKAIGAQAGRAGLYVNRLNPTALMPPGRRPACAGWRPWETIDSTGACGSGFVWNARSGFLRPTSGR